VPDDLWITLVHARGDGEVGISGEVERQLFRATTPKHHDDSLRALESAFAGVAPALQDGAVALPTLRRAIDVLHQPGKFKYDEVRAQSDGAQELIARLHYCFQDCAVGLSSIGNTIYVIGSQNMADQILARLPSAVVVGGGKVRNIGYNLDTEYCIPKTDAPLG
jgi:predicted sugar kinase